MKPHFPQLAVALFMFCMSNASATVLYVDLNSTNPTPPYASWSMASRDIQGAIDASSDGDQIWVNDGIYNTGGRVVYGSLTNRVAINKAITVQSVNGPAVTLIQGYQVASTINGDDAVRCAYLTNGATLEGFKLTNGATRITGDYTNEECGGGVWCESVSAVVFNCVLARNAAYSSAGGIYSGWVINCVLDGNSAGSRGGGTYNSVLINSTVIHNSAISGGGVEAGEVYSCILSNNTATFGGGAFSTTLNGCTLTSNSVPGGQGGGAFQCILRNCTLVGNSAGDAGGGAYQGTLNNCVLNNNFADYTGGGGAANATLNDCTLSGNSTYDFGGGAYQGVLNNCTLTGNWAAYGGGAHNALLNNCMISSNSVSGGQGGGVYRGTLHNCILIGNSSAYGSAAAAAGAEYSSFCILNNCTLIWNSANGAGDAATTENATLNNCIVYFNSATKNANVDPYSALNYCCTTPLPSSGTGNITNCPLFVDVLAGSLRLQSNSPCINAGANYWVGTASDFDGNPRIVGGTVDIGAYEFQSPVSIISYAWLNQYNLSINTNTDSSDVDSDGMNNWQEFIAGTDPTNALSVLKMLAPSNGVSGVTLNWQSVSGRTYYLQRVTNLLLNPTFSSIQSNIIGHVATTSFTDTTATNGWPYFYRVGVQQ
jgi:hypothetical protein